MPTECSAEPLLFAPVESRSVVVAAFDGGGHHLGCWSAAARCDGSGDRSRLGAWPVASPNRRLPELGRARGRDARHAAGLRAGARLRGFERPRRAAPRSDHGGAGRQAFAAQTRSAARRSPASRPSTGSSVRSPRRRATTRSAHDPTSDRGAVRRSCSSKRTAGHKRRSCSTSTPPTTRCTATRRGASFTAITAAIATCRSTSSAAAISSPPSCSRANIDASAGAVDEVARHRRGDPRLLAPCAHPAARRLGLRP